MQNNNEHPKDDPAQKEPPSSKNMEIGPGKILCQKYFVSQKIGQGSFGLVYAGYDLKTSESLAIKVEEFQDKNHVRKKEILLKEAKFLYSLNGEKGFPKMIYFTKTDSKRVMIMPLLGRNLEHLLRKCGKKFTLKTVLMMADQMITRLEFIHSKDIIHRDLKPENFLVGLDKSCNTIYLIDFGLAKKYREKGVHIPFKEKVGLVGTARYTSINSHLGNEQSRRDDLESLGYILIYFLKGELPWMNLNGSTKEEKHKLIVACKKSLTVEKLCEGLPQEFCEYMNYARNILKFDEEPNYGHLKKMFRTLLLNSKLDMNYVFDWQCLEKTPTINKNNQSEFQEKLSFNEKMMQTNKKVNKTFDVIELKRTKKAELNYTHKVYRDSNGNIENDFLTVSKTRLQQTSKAINLNMTNFMENEDNEFKDLDEFDIISDGKLFGVAGIHQMKMNPFGNKSISTLNKSFGGTNIKDFEEIAESENLEENTLNEYRSRIRVNDLVKTLGKINPKYVINVFY